MFIQVAPIKSGPRPKHTLVSLLEKENGEQEKKFSKEWGGDEKEAKTIPEENWKTEREQISVRRSEERDARNVNRSHTAH